VIITAVLFQSGSFCIRFIVSTIKFCSPRGLEYPACPSWNALLLQIFYNQRNKDETIISVIKRLIGEHITSRLVTIQIHRTTNLTIILLLMVTRAYDFGEI